MYKVIFLLFISICLSCLNAMCADNSSSNWGENSSVFNKGFDEQKAVTDTKLNKTIEMLKERSLSRKQKKLRNEVKPLSPLSDEEYLKKFTNEQNPDDSLSQTMTVMIPMKAYNDEGITINPGYYKLSCRKVSDNLYVLDLSQGTQKVMTVDAKQTQQDLNQESISFCNSEIIDGGRIRLMYGSIDLNLVGYIYY